MRAGWVPAIGLAAAVLVDFPVLADNLTGFQWENRLVLSFAPDAEDERARRQRQNQAQAQAAWSDRQLVLIEVAAGGAVRVDGEVTPELNGAALRRQFEVPPAHYAAVLVGKDGGEKWRVPAAMPNPDLFQMIDAMPMRQQEMRGN